MRISEKGIYVGTGVRVLESEKIDIGVRTVISDCVTLDGRGGIKIGTGCIISRGVKILTASHDYKSSNFELILKSVEIGDQVWLAEDCKIMPGTRIGNRCVVGAGVILAENLADDEVVTINKRFKKLKEDVMDKNTGFKLIGFKF
ncbi:MAG: acyltransferase [Oceanospirillaceae bacterium]|nr:acyltransferase [Oceanospirillaceae bacterium]